MTKEDIIRKLEAELNGGITTEPQVVYLMTGLRKLLEQQQAKKQYEYLTFHCDWVLHSKLQGPTAQKVLEQFDLANIHLKIGIKLHGLPVDLQREINGISKMEWFREELSTFLAANGLPGLETVHRDGWDHFLQLYCKVIEDCPLVMTTNNTAASIEKVTVHLEWANQVVENEIFYKIMWTVADKNGLSGDIFVINSFSLTPR
ncbi:MAG: hypothetical protein HYS38_04540 [Acidobacteria bacterium]|nr:hypothetical protein [Acidobacteriota bacterium]